MKRPGRSPDQSNLDFDLPLRTSPGEPEEVAKEQPETESEAAADLPLFPEPEAPAAGKGVAEPPPAPAAAGASSEPPEAEIEEPVTFGLRLLAGLADLAVHGGILVLAVLGQSLLGLAPAASQVPAYTVFLLAFSFLYCVVPMAFWGQTPGMASLGLFVRTQEGENLTFPQTALRWGAAVLTFGLLGLPLLIALSGRSLGDRWSRSQTHRFRPGGPGL